MSPQSFSCSLTLKLHFVYPASPRAMHHLVPSVEGTLIIPWLDLCQFRSELQKEWEVKGQQTRTFHKIHKEFIRGGDRP